jgi:hypothetical protein
MTLRIISTKIKPTFVHVFLAPSGAQRVVDYDDYDEAMKHLDDGLTIRGGGTYRCTLEIPSDMSTGIKRFNAEDRLPAWKADRDADQTSQNADIRWFGGAR